MKVAVFDYGAGNLHSLAKALAAPGVELCIEQDPRRAATADAVVLPGVGAFPLAAARLAPGRDALRSAVRAGLPCLGICLGMQLLFEASDEGAGQGLGVIEGRVERLRARRSPHMGWNAIEDARDPLLVRSGLDLAYFAHGFACRPASAATVVAWTRHETDRFASVVRVDRAVGVQFHPEKSSDAGVRFLAAWLAEVADATARIPAVAARMERP